MKIGNFEIRFFFRSSGRIDAVIYEDGALADGVLPGYDFGKVSAAAVRAVRFYQELDKKGGVK